MDLGELKKLVADSTPSIAIIASFGGICSAAVAKAGVFYLGRSFTPTQFGIESLALGAVIGAIQGLVPLLFTEKMVESLSSKDENMPEVVALFLSHQAVTLGLVALTAVAAKAGLIASGLTLFGGLALCTTSYAVNCGLYYILGD